MTSLLVCANARVAWPPNRILATVMCSASFPVEYDGGRKGQSVWVVDQDTIWEWSISGDGDVVLEGQS